VRSGDDHREQPQRDKPEKFRHRQLARGVGGFARVLEFFEQGFPQLLAGACALDVHGRLALAVEAVRQQRLIGAECREHGFAEFPAHAPVARDERLKDLMRFIGAVQLLLAGLAVAHDRSLHLADLVVLDDLDAPGEGGAAGVIGLMDPGVPGFGGGLRGIDFHLAGGGQFVNPAGEFLRVHFLALEHFPADELEALGPVFDQRLLTGDDGGNTGFKVFELFPHGAEIDGFSRSLHELFLASGRVRR